MHLFIFSHSFNLVCLVITLWVFPSNIISIGALDDLNLWQEFPRKCVHDYLYKHEEESY